MSGAAKSSKAIKLPDPVEIGPNFYGIVTSTSYSLGDNNEILKTEKVVKRIPFSRLVSPDHEFIAKMFATPLSNEATGKVEEVKMTRFNDDGTVLEDEKKVSLAASIVCSKCRGNHFSSSCTMADVHSTQPVAKSSNYVPPSAAVAADPNAPNPFPTDLRIGNISPEADEAYIRSIFKQFGHINRLIMPRNDEGELKGYAFLSFSEHESAARALKEMDKFAIGHSFISVDWSKSRSGAGGGGGGGSKFQSGYGKKLAQDVKR